MNKVILMGRIIKDPEVKYVNDLAICKYTLAVNKKFKKEGEPEADFINCVVLGKQAEFSEKYFKKGMMISISGRLQVRSWEDKEKGRQWSTEVLIEEQEFAESKASFEARNGKPYKTPEGFTAIEEDIDEDDLPF